MEEQQAQTTPETTATESTETVQPQTTPAPVAPAVPDWREMLDKVDPAELRKHPRFAGILGSELSAQQQRQEARLAEEARARALKEQDDEIARLADENDEVLTEKYPKAREAFQRIKTQRAEQEFQQKVGETKGAFYRRVGQSYASLPDWKDVISDPVANQRLQDAIAAAPDEDSQITAFTTTAAELLSTVKAEKAYKARFAKEMEAAKAAMRQELAAEGLSTSDAPDLRKPNGQLSKAAAILKMDEKDFERRYKELFG